MQIHLILNWIRGTILGENYMKGYLKNVYSNANKVRIANYIGFKVHRKLIS